MDVYRCRFCGETHLGLGKITNCPFCGAHQRYMVPIEEWKEENKDVEYGELSKKNLEIALDVEIGNASFYLQAAKDFQTDVAYGIFKRLSKVENEHAQVFAKILNVDLPELIQIESKGSDRANFEESKRRETHAVEHYTKSSKEATEPRIIEIFSTLMEIESDHLRLDGQMLAE